MRGIRDWGLWAVVCTLAAGCTPSPEKMCDHYVELKQKESAKADATVRSECATKLGELKGRSSKAWGCTAGCMKRATSVKDADQCPWSCEKQYGNDGKSFTGDAEREVQARWENGIVQGAPKDNVPAILREKASMEAKAFQVCIPRCKGQYDVGTNQYKLCLELCKKEQYKKMK